MLSVWGTHETLYKFILCRFWYWFFGSADDCYGLLNAIFFEIPMLTGALLMDGIMVLYSFWGDIKVIAMTDVV